MGTLHSFADHINRRRELIKGVENQLSKLQAQYESCFREVTQVRDHELSQLASEISRRAGALPLGLDAALAAARKQVEADLDGKLADLRKQHDAVAAEAHKTRAYSIELEDSVHQQNADLDAQEENLKARNEVLLKAIDDYNARIRTMGSGFGFFVNFFKMRTLQQERARIDQEQADLVAHVDALRMRWANRDQDHAREQKNLHERWTELSTRAAGLQAAIDHLQETRPAYVTRTALERVLFDRFPEVNPDQTSGAVPCPRCRTGNAPTQSFCRVCAQRIKADRPDLEGSIVEIAEVNHHFRRFSEGMKGCQELIGLLVGVRSGLEAFKKSVASMISSQNEYSLRELAIDIPRECIAFEQRFEALPALVQNKASHPLDFANLAKSAVAALNQNTLQQYFERLGQELSRQAKAQWG